MTISANASRALALAAAPSFALMAAVGAGAPHAALCGPGASGLPIDGMTAMYLLMSLFHLPPWLTLVLRSNSLPGEGRDPGRAGR